LIICNVFWRRLVALVSFAFTGPLKIALDWFEVTRNEDTLFFVIVPSVCALCFLLLYASNLFNSVFGREFLVGASRAEVGADSSPDAHGVFVRTLAPLSSHSTLRHYLYDHPYCPSAIVNFLNQTPQTDISLEERRHLPLSKSSVRTSFLRKWLLRVLAVCATYLVAYTFGFVQKIAVTKPDSVEIQLQHYQLLGYDAPRPNMRSCEGEIAQANRVVGRLRELVRRRKVEFHRVRCPCRYEDFDDCDYSDRCGRLEIDGEDVATILIREGYAYPYYCDHSHCSPRHVWCARGRLRNRMLSD
jgi:hypothetical protein